MPASRVSDAIIGSGSGGSVAPSPPESLTRKKSKSGRLKKLGGSLRRKLSNIGGKKKGGNSSKEKGGSGSDVCGGGETAVSHQELATSQQQHTAAAAEAAAATVQKPIVRSVKINKQNSTLLPSISREDPGGVLHTSCKCGTRHPTNVLSKSAASYLRHLC